MKFIKSSLHHNFKMIFKKLNKSKMFKIKKENNNAYK